MDNIFNGGFFVRLVELIKEFFAKLFSKFGPQPIE